MTQLLMEGQLSPEKKVWPTLRLKNGSEMNVLSAYVCWKALEELTGPDQLKALSALAEGDDAKVKMRMRAQLMTDFPTWFDDDGALQAGAKDAIQSAVRDSSEGKVVVTPFVVTTQEEVESLQHIHQMFARARAQTIQTWADALSDKEQLSAANRELRHDTRRLAKKLKREAENPDDPGYSRPR